MAHHFIYIPAPTLSIPSLLWLDSSNSSSSQWDDLSGNNNHAYQSNSSIRPTQITESGLNVFNFDGSQYFQTNNNISITSNSHCWISLFKPFAITEKSLWGYAESNTTNYLRTGIFFTGYSACRIHPLDQDNIETFFSTNSWYLLCLNRLNSTAIAYRYISSLSSVGSFDNCIQNYTASGQIQIGNSLNGAVPPFVGRIAYLKIFAQALTTEQLTTEMVYVKNRFSAALSI